MSEAVKITVKTTRTLLLPMLPNFLRTEGSNEALTAIKQWKEQT